VPTTVAVAGAA